MSDDYISREEAEKAAIDAADEWDGGCNLNRWRIIKKGIRAIPAADVRPVVRGKWIEYTRVVVPEPYNKWEQAWKCDKCGFDDGFPAYNFCPHCGADMRQTGDENV